VIRTVGVMLVAMGVCAAAVAAGSIEGTLRPGAAVKAVWAIARAPRDAFKLDNVKHRGEFDPKTGLFSIPRLAAGTYDLLIELDGLSIEGVDLRLRKETPPLYDLALSTGEISTHGLDPARDLAQEEFDSQEEKDQATRLFFHIGSLEKRLASLLKVERFVDKARGLYVHGGKREANILMMLARFGPFHAQEGQEVIWRLEVWPMRWYYGGWAKGRAYVVDRQRLGAAEYRTMARLFDPKLGGIDVQDGKPARLEYTIPAKPGEAMGKLAGKEL